MNRGLNFFNDSNQKETFLFTSDGLPSTFFWLKTRSLCDLGDPKAYLLKTEEML